MVDRSWIIFLGGCLLAFGAAFANVGMFLQTGTSVSHLTGDISKLSIDLARLNPELYWDFIRVLTAAVSFLMGALVSGFLIHHPTLDLARPYGRTVTSIGFLFFLSFLLVQKNPVISIGFAAFGCGLQNALATQYRGIILRTTHVTGLMTDLGVMLGMRIRGMAIPLWKIMIPTCLIVSFFLGGMVSCLFQYELEQAPLRIAGLGYMTAGVCWTIYKHRVWMRRKVE